MQSHMVVLADGGKPHVSSADQPDLSAFAAPELIRYITFANCADGLYLDGPLSCRPAESLEIPSTPLPCLFRAS
jgi:hypothetical protein